VYLFWKVILKTMFYTHCRQKKKKKFRRKAPVSVIAKMIKKFRETGSQEKLRGTW
jgi:predicted kinase